MRSGWTSKSQQRQADVVANKLNQVVKVGRMQPVAIAGFAAESDLKTRGAQISFQVASLQGIDSFVLLRNFSRDPGSAQIVHVWTAGSLKATPQTFPLNLQHVDADPAIAGKVAYYWIKAVPVSNQTTANVVLSGPQKFDASGLPVAKQIAGDFASYQAYTPTTQPLSAATGVGANQATISIASFQIQYPFDANNDGTPDLVSYSSGTITPLLDATTYYIYFDDPDYSGGAQTYIATTDQTQVTAGLHRQYIGSIKTPAHGGGGTTGFGGGGGSCFSGNTQIVVRNGRKDIADVKRGELVLSRKGWRRVKQLLVHEFDGELREMGNGELVTPGHALHPMVGGSGWVPAGSVFPVTVRFKGRVYNLELESRADKGDDTRCYQLGNGWFAHNAIKQVQ